MHQTLYHQVPDINTITPSQIEQMRVRSVFHDHENALWLKKRHGDKVRFKYLYTPEEKQLQMEIKQIFKVFDNDDSQSFDLAEMFTMFKHFGFSISLSELQAIYKFVDHNKDNKLDFLEFKSLTEHPEALRFFRNTMMRIQHSINTKPNIKNKPPFVPLSVGAMLTYLSYMLEREKQLKILKGKNYTVDEKCQAFTLLLSTKQSHSVVDQALSIYNKMQQQLSAKYRESKKSLDLVQVPEIKSNYRQSFSTLTGLQPQLFRNMSMKDASEIQRMTQLIQAKQCATIVDMSEQSFSSFKSDDSTPQESLLAVIKEGVIAGQTKAEKIIKSKRGQSLKTESMTDRLPIIKPVTVSMKSSKAISNKQMVIRPFRLKTYKLQSDDLTDYKQSLLYSDRSRHQSTLASLEQTVISRSPTEFQYCNSQRDLQTKLPYIQ